MEMSETKDSEVESAKGGKWRIIRNVVAISLAFMVHFTAFNGAVNLQSSINAGLGQVSLAIIYASLILSNVFLPAVMIRYLGCKFSVALSFIAYMPYIAAQFYPVTYTMIPAALAVGIGGGPLWCAKCMYLTVISEAYSVITDTPPDVLVVQFFGIFFMIFQFAQIWGNLISSTVLSTDATGGTSLNSTMIQATCGPNFCPGDASNETLSSIGDEKIKIIAGIYLICMACAVLIVVLFVDPLSRYDKDRTQKDTIRSGTNLLAVTMKLLKEHDQLLLLPITIWLGIAQAFLGADFTAAFVTCAWGVQNIGYVMIGYGVVNSISAITTGWLVKFTGRVAIVSSAAVVHVLLLIFLLIWTPTGRADERYIFFLITGVWGLADGVWLVQINAFYGILFRGREEAAYSNFRLWESLGYISAYIYSTLLCTSTKLYLSLAILILGMLGYLTVETLKHRKRKEMA